MIVFLIVVALVSGGATVFLLWPFSHAVAMIAAPFVASLTVAVTAVALAARAGNRGHSTRETPLAAVLRAFSRLMSR
jgi:hypothetical protein